MIIIVYHSNDIYYYKTIMSYKNNKPLMIAS